MFKHRLVVSYSYLTSLQFGRDQLADITQEVTLNIHLDMGFVGGDVLQVFAPFPRVKADKERIRVLQEVLAEPYCRSSFKTTHL